MGRHRLREHAQAPSVVHWEAIAVPGAAVRGYPEGMARIRGEKRPLDGESTSNKAGRFSRLPDRVNPDELVESQPEAPRPEPAYDENVDAVRWYGIPL